MTQAPNTSYGLFTEDGLDQQLYGLREAKREAKDLRAMGLTVQIVKAEGEGDHDAALDIIDQTIRFSSAERRKVTSTTLAKAKQPNVTLNIMTGV